MSKPLKYLGIDLSYAKSGVSIISVKDRKPTIDLAYLILSNKDRVSHIRIDETVTEIKYMAGKHDVMAIVKESGVVGQSSTAIPVAKTHAVLEDQLSDRFKIDNVHPSTIKAYARNILGEEAVAQLKIDEPKKHGKLVVGRAVEEYYGDSVRELLYTPRGRYIDDIGDAILLITLWLEKNNLIDVKK